MATFIYFQAVLFAVTTGVIAIGVLLTLYLIAISDLTK